MTGCGGGGGGTGGPESSVINSGRNDELPVVVSNVCTDPGVPNFASATDPSTQQPNHLYRWPNFPVRIYFQNDAERTPERRAETLSGFNWWAQSTNGLVRYVLTENPGEANITVIFAHQGQNGHGAITEYHVTSDGILTNATITFNLTYLTKIRYFRPIAAHEMGHALGIGGHSPSAEDVMSPGSSAYDHTALSERDINTLLLAYCASRSTSAVSRNTGRSVFECFDD